MRKISFQSVLFVLMLLCLSGFRLKAQDAVPEEIKILLTKHLCNACHQLDTVRIGPSYRQLAKAAESEKQIRGLIVQPIPSNWPDFPPMAPMPHLPEEDVRRIAKWIVALKDR